MKSILSYSLIFLIGYAAGFGQAHTSVDENAIDEIFSTWNKEGSPGASLAVVSDGQIVFKKGYGLANLEYDIPNQPNTIFHIASVSKQFTVFAILLLQERGRLHLDDDVRKYIPEVPDFGHKITLRHLATHTSGLRDQWNILAMAGWQLDDVITKNHVMKLVSRQRALNFHPGDQYTYCNTGFTLLAEVVSRVSGRPFAQFAQENIFEPLEMAHTLFYDDHEQIVKNRAYSYAQTPVGLKKRVLSYANVGATSLFTTVEDLAKWVSNFESTKVGSDGIVQLMETRTILNDGDTITGAMGQFVTDYQGHRQVQHGGADAGYRSYLARFPEDKLSVIVLGNIAQLNPSRLALQVADLFLEDKEVHSSEHAHTKPVVDLIEMSQKQLKAFTGSYWNADRKYLRKIFLNNDTLRYARGNGFNSPIVPINDSTFQMLRVSSDLKVQFGSHENGRTMAVTVNGGEPTISHYFEPMDSDQSLLQEYVGTYYSPELETYYRFTVNAGGMLVTHSRLPNFSLKPIKTDLFTGNRWYFSTVEFQRNDIGKIIGLTVSSDRVKNLWFDKTD